MRAIDETDPRIARYVLVILLAIAALNAFGGGVYGMLGAKGVPREWLAGSPFVSYFVPGLFLFAALGGSSLLAAITVLRRWELAWALAVAVGVLVLAWIVVQVAIIGYVSWLQPVTAAAGLAIVRLALRLR